MTRITKTVHVRFSPADMYGLVNAVERYPEFLPWCAGAVVRDRTDTTLTATLTLAKGPLRHAFTTRNRLEPNRRIELALVEGPFKSLRGEWNFSADPGGGSTVSLDLEFAFSQRALALTVGPLFSHIAKTLVDAFRARAEALFGGD